MKVFCVPDSFGTQQATCDVDGRIMTAAETNPARDLWHDTTDVSTIHASRRIQLMVEAAQCWWSMPTPRRIWLSTSKIKALKVLRKCLLFFDNDILSQSSAPHH
jgi:hypothetical protein